MDVKVLEKMSAYKEILSTMPKNNDKNIEKFNSKVDEIIDEYKKYKSDILNEISKRYARNTRLSSNSNINSLENEMENYELILEVINDIKSSYEKTNLDKEVYKLGKFYKENLENVNNQIMTCINIFRNIGISIQDQDFSSSKYALEYMKVFLDEMKTGNIDSQNIKETFEKVYWKCPDLIIHIEVIINNIYLKNKKQIDKVYEDKKEETFKKYKINVENILLNYKSNQKQLEKETSLDKKKILDNFLSGIWNTKDYEEEKIEKIYQKYIIPEALNNEVMDEINENIDKFTRSIYEYKEYLKYKYIIDNIKEKFSEKENYKNAYKDNLKEIDKCESQLKKLNKPSIFGKKEIDDIKVNELFLKERDIFKELSKNIIYYKISENITENSSLLDILCFASSFYKFLVDAIIKQNQEITPDEIDEVIKDLKRYIKFPYFTIINNIKMIEDKDIALIIKDRYKLLNFNIEKEDLQEDNLENLYDEFQKINIYNNIKNAGLNLEDIKNVCEYKKILGKEQMN